MRNVVAFQEWFCWSLWRCDYKCAEAGFLLPCTKSEAFLDAEWVCSFFFSPMYLLASKCSTVSSFPLLGKRDYKIPLFIVSFALSFIVIICLHDSLSRLKTNNRVDVVAWQWSHSLGCTCPSLEYLTDPVTSWWGTYDSLSTWAPTTHVGNSDSWLQPDPAAPVADL